MGLKYVSLKHFPNHGSGDPIRTPVVATLTYLVGRNNGKSDVTQSLTHQHQECLLFKEDMIWSLSSAPEFFT
jgi:hypothetical protein